MDFLKTSEHLRVKYCNVINEITSQNDMLYNEIFVLNSRQKLNDQCYTNISTKYLALVDSIDFLSNLKFEETSNEYVVKKQKEILKIYEEEHETISSKNVKLISK